MTLLTLPTDTLAADAPAGDWVGAPALLDGAGHAVVTWLECDGLGAPLCTAPPELAGGAAFGPLAHVHAAQYATFAPTGAPWRIAAGSAVQLRASVAADGVCVELQAPLARITSAPSAASIPDYHCAMLNDAPRNAAYHAGLVAAVASHRARSGGDAPRVLDIGAGAGLLSMLAARGGAAEVVAVERDEALAECACADAEANGLGESITVVAAHSRDLGRHNVGEFDVIVSEVFGSDALSEGVLPTLAHARTALLAPGGVFVPARVVIRAALARSGALACVLASARDAAPATAAAPPLEERVLRAFDALAPTRCSCHLPDVPGAQLLSDVAEFAIDLNAAPLPTQGALRASARAVCAGDADSVLYWFQVGFDGGAHVATGPDDGRRQHWPQTLFRLDAPRRVAVGDVIELRMQYIGDRTMFQLLPAA